MKFLVLLVSSSVALKINHQDTRDDYEYNDQRGVYNSFDNQPYASTNGVYNSGDAYRQNFGSGPSTQYTTVATQPRTATTTQGDAGTLLTNNVNQQYVAQPTEVQPDIPTNRPRYSYGVDSQHPNSFTSLFGGDGTTVGNSYGNVKEINLDQPKWSQQIQASQSQQSPDTQRGTSYTYDRDNTAQGTTATTNSYAFPAQAQTSSSSWRNNYDTDYPQSNYETPRVIPSTTSTTGFQQGSASSVYTAPSTVATTTTTTTTNSVPTSYTTPTSYATPTSTTYSSTPSTTSYGGSIALPYESGKTATTQNYGTYALPSYSTTGTTTNSDTRPGNGYSYAYGATNNQYNNGVRPSNNYYQGSSTGYSSDSSTGYPSGSQRGTNNPSYSNANNYSSGNSGGASNSRRNNQSRKPTESLKKCCEENGFKEGVKWGWSSTHRKQTWECIGRNSKNQKYQVAAEQFDCD